jgi:hypothetical protein
MDLDAQFRTLSSACQVHARKAAEEARLARQDAARYGDTPDGRNARWQATRTAEQAEALAVRWAVRSRAAAEGKVAITQHDDGQWAAMSWNLRCQPGRTFAYVEGADD